MPIIVRAGTDLGLVVIAFQGIVTAEEIDQRGDQLFEGTEFIHMPLALFDTTALVRVEAPSEFVGRYARRAAKRIDADIDVGTKTAFVATRDAFFGLSRMYQAHRDESTGEFSVFRTLSEAEQWLGLPEGYEAQLINVLSAD